MNHRALSALVATITTLGLGTTLTSSALAHPGHHLDTTGVGLMHFLLHPSHGGIALAAVAVLAAVVLLRKRRRRG